MGAVWEVRSPLKFIFGGILICSAVSPTRPFSLVTPRLRLIGVFASGLLVSFLTTSYVFGKISTLFAGAAFFSDPIIQQGIHYLNRVHPQWKELFQLQK